MEKEITITVPDDMVADLEEAAREGSCADEEIVLDVLKRYLLVRRIHLMREEMIPKAQNLGVFTDQDVFDRVS